MHDGRVQRRLDQSNTMQHATGAVATIAAGDASDTCMSDVRHALRIFSKSPGFTAVLLLTLALGIGANTAVFSIIDGVLLRPLPYQDPGRLIDILDTSLRE